MHALLLFLTLSVAQANPFMFGLSAPPAGGGNTLTNGLVAYWKLEEASGTRADSEPTGTAQNMTANATSGTIANTTGKQGNAILFSRANGEYLSHVDSTDLRVSGSFTIDFWVKPTTLPGAGAFYGLVCKGNTFNGTTDEYDVYLDGSSGNVIAFAVGNGAAQGVAVTSALTAGTWYYVCAQYNAVAQTVAVSLNGGSFTPSSYTGGTHTTTGGFFIGTGQASNHRANAAMDEVGFWNRVLTSGEIAQRYAAGVGMTLP